MAPIPRTRFARLLRGLSPDEFVSFVADLWAARGWTTEVRDDVVIATRDEPTRERHVLLVRHSSPLLDRVEWATDRTDVTHVLSSGAGSDDADELAVALDATLVDRSDVYDMAVYALSPTRREELFRRHFDRSATVGEQSGAVAAITTGLATRRGKVAAIAIVLLLFAVASGAVSLGDDPPGPTGVSDDDGPTVVTATPEPFTVRDPGTTTAWDTETPTATATDTTPAVTTNRSELVVRSDRGDRWELFRADSARTGHHPEALGPRSDVGVLARFATEFGFVSSPAVVGETVYLGNVDGVFYALDARTLRVRWDRYLDGSILSSPAIVDETVYVGSGAGMRPGTVAEATDRLHAIDMERGDVRWNASTGPISVSSPVLVDGTAYVGGTDGSVYAVEAANGSVSWSTATNGTVDASPSVVDGTIYVGSSDGLLYALDAANGSVDWRTDTDGTVLSTAPVWNGTVYAGASHGSVYGENTSGSLSALDAENGSVVWRHDTEAGIVSSPAIADDAVYVAAMDGTVRALDAGNGSVVWRRSAEDEIVSSPVVVNETVYVGGTDGTMYAFEAHSGDVLWSFDVGASIQSSPAVANGVVYVATDSGHVYALAERSRE